MSDTPNSPSSTRDDSADNAPRVVNAHAYYEGGVTAGGDFVAGDKIIQQAAAPVGAAALHQLPAPPADFTGRQTELEALRTAVQSAGKTIVAVRGQGGVGKSTLALVLAQALAPVYPDAQLLVELHGAAEQQPMTPGEALAHFIHAFEPTAQLPEALPARQAIYRSLLNGKRALVVLDNARDRDQVEPLLPPPGCLVLLTSRQRFSLPGFDPLNLASLPRADSAALLVKIAPRLADDGATQAEALAELCGDLPLALRLAGSALADSEDLAVADYVARLTDEQHRLAEFGEVAQALAASYSLLTAAQQAAWPPLAVFAGDFDRPAAAAVLALDEAAVGTALSGLLRYSLVDYDPTTERYRLHDLARLAADKQLSAEAREIAARRHAEHYLGVLDRADTRYQAGGDDILPALEVFDAERANLETGQAWAAEHAAADEAAARLCSDFPQVGAYVLNLRQHPRQRIVWLEAALAAAQRQQDREALGRHLANLGLAYASLSETRRAIEFYEQHLALSRELGVRSSEGQALGNLGSAYSDLGDFRRAIEFQEQSLAIARELGDRHGESVSLANLGNAYLALDEPRRAIEFLEQALAILPAIGDRRSEGTVLGNLGAAYADLDETQRAIALYAQALAINRELGDRSSEAAALTNLANVHTDLGEAERAIELYEQALAIARELGDRRDEARALGNLGNVYTNLGETERAIELYEQRLRLVRELGDRKGEGQTLGSLGLVYADRNEPQRAIELYEQALAIAREASDRRQEADALVNLAVAHFVLGDSRRTIELNEQALVIQRELGDQQGEVAALLNLGAAHADLGENSRAVQFYTQCLALVRTLGDRDGEGQALLNLGPVYADLGELRKAQETFEQLLPIARELGEAHEEGQALWGLSQTLDQLGEREAALAQAEAALRVWEAVQDPLADMAGRQVSEWKGGSE